MRISIDIPVNVLAAGLIGISQSMTFKPTPEAIRRIYEVKEITISEDDINDSNKELLPLMLTQIALIKIMKELSETEDVYKLFAPNIL